MKRLATTFLMFSGPLKKTAIFDPAFTRSRAALTGRFVTHESAATASMRQLQINEMAVLRFIV